ncbi:MAG: hypothetical protein AAF636_11405 [Pseudomonadota bacterium]
MAYRKCRQLGMETTPRNLNKAYRLCYRELNPAPTKPKEPKKKLSDWERKAIEREKAIQRAQGID